LINRCDCGITGNQIQKDNCPYREKNNLTHINSLKAFFSAGITEKAIYNFYSSIGCGHYLLIKIRWKENITTPYKKNMELP
jgi:hypothetical protein